MSQEFNIYEEEERVIETTRSIILNKGSVTTLDYENALANLLIQYERLFRVTKHLINISDRKEEELNSKNRRLARLADVLEYQATHDLLTNIFNKSSIADYISKCLSQTDMTLISYDIDDFKIVNDTYGHLIGDYVIKWVVNLVNQTLNGTGIQGRTGGEEFMIAMPVTTLNQGFEIAEKLRQEVEYAEFRHDILKMKVTISLGVTYCFQGENFEAVYARADQALYKAKQNGRNRVEIA